MTTCVKEIIACVSIVAKSLRNDEPIAAGPLIISCSSGRTSNPTQPPRKLAADLHA